MLRNEAVRMVEETVRKLNRRRGIGAKFDNEDGAFHIVISVSGQTSLKSAINAVSWLMGPNNPFDGKRLIIPTRLYKKDNPGRDFRFVIT